MVSPELNIKKCIACKSDIHSDATICSICQSYQLNWKNNLKFISSIIGIASIIGALFIYSVTNLSQIRKSIFWNDKISVISFVSFNHITVSNNGDGSVYLSNLSFGPDSDQGTYSYIRDIGVTLKPGEIKRISLPDKFIKSHYITVGGIDDEKWSQILSKSLSLSSQCYAYNIFLSNDPSYINMKNIYSKNKHSPLRTFDAKAVLAFYDTHSGKVVNYKLPVVGTVSVDTQSDGCKSE